MTRPPLARFLDDPLQGSGIEARSDEVGATYEELLDVVATIVTRRGVPAIAETTGLDRALLEFLETKPGPDLSDPPDGLTVAAAAEILAVDSTFSATEIRARIRDHLVVRMSRHPIDVETLAGAYGFGDATQLRERIEGVRPLSLREYARIRVALPGEPRESNRRANRNA